MKKTLNLALLISFIITIMVPLTGIHIHKMASVIFLLLSVIHTIVYRKQLGVKRWFMLALIAISFATGLLGMILDQFPLILRSHRAISIGVVFFLAIHIFVFRKKLCRDSNIIVHRDILLPLYHFSLQSFFRNTKI